MGGSELIHLLQKILATSAIKSYILGRKQKTEKLPQPDPKLKTWEYPLLQLHIFSDSMLNSPKLNTGS